MCVTILTCGDLTDFNYSSAYDDNQWILEDYQTQFVDVINENLPTSKILSCYNNHLLLYWIIKKKMIQYTDLKLLVFDAHQEMKQGELNSCTFLRWLVEESILDSNNLMLVGIRVFDNNQLIEKHQINQITTQQCNDIQGTIRQIHSWAFGSPLYVSFDIDVLDPCIAPGCLDQEPGGLELKQALDLLISLSGYDVVGCDLTEVNLRMDPTGKTLEVSKEIITLMYDILKNQP